MKNVLPIILLISFCGCAHHQPTGNIPAYEDLTHLRYMCMKRVDIPTVERSETFDFDIWFSQDSCRLQYAAGPHVIEVSTLVPTNRTFTSEIFRCDISPELARQFYGRLINGCLKTLPIAETPGSESCDDFFMLFCRDGAIMWFLRDELRTKERLVLHQEIVTFVRARIAEHPEGLELREIGIQDMIRKNDSTEPTNPPYSLPAAGSKR